MLYGGGKKVLEFRKHVEGVGHVQLTKVELYKSVLSSYI